MITKEALASRGFKEVRRYSENKSITRWQDDQGMNFDYNETLGQINMFFCGLMKIDNEEQLDQVVSFHHQIAATLYNSSKT